MAMMELRRLLSPEYRYRYARLIHAARVGLSILTSILLTSALHVPHGEWASITVVIVIGGLQHHGNIRRKAVERAMGTLIGAASGLLIIMQQSYFGTPVLTNAIIVAACGLCAYHAIGKGGYVALLTAITIFIVAGHGDNSLSDGLWRVVNIILGDAIALAFSFALPLYATWTWRHNLAEELRGCASFYIGIAGGVRRSRSRDPHAMAGLSAGLVRLRALMPSVSREAAIPLEKMEEIQRSLRICTSALDLMASMKERVGGEHPLENCKLIHALLGMGRALKFGKLQYLQRPMPIPADLADPDGYSLLNLELHREVDTLRQHLSETAKNWNI